MSKRDHIREVESVFDQINVKLSEDATTFTPDIQGFTQSLKKLKEKLLDKATSKTIAAGDFTMETAILTFGLQYVESSPEYLWKIEDIPENKDSPKSSFDAILAKYAQTVDRSSEAACRTPIDLILIECVAELQCKADTLTDDRARTPGPHKYVKICCEISFSHELSPKPIGEAAIAIDHATTVDGRVNYGIGIVTFGRKVPNRCFHSLLIVVEAKAKNHLEVAFPQLIVYLACLRQARKARRRSDCSVYGIASDGYAFYFVTITHEGVVKVSRRFSISWGDTQMIMGCIMYILRKTVERSLTVTPEKVESSDGSRG